MQQTLKTLASYLLSKTSMVLVLSTIHIASVKLDTMQILYSVLKKTGDLMKTNNMVMLTMEAYVLLVEFFKMEVA